jgi:Epoxide hydrolase N terminus
MTMSEIESVSATLAWPARRGAGEDRSIRTFTAQFSQAAIDDLGGRINATKWPERETVTDSSQGVQLASTQSLARYWATDKSRRRQGGTP